MDEQEKQKILIKSKNFFENKIAKKHISNTKKLGLRDFNINPFTHKYLAQFAYGDSSPESLAKVLVYPRVLGTSISTTFGSQLQQFCNEVLNSYASTTSGIDIEFIDAVDNRRKYCQIKSGPNCINKDDVETIEGHFKGVKNLARTNGLHLQTNDCVVGIFYGTNEDINNNFKIIDEDYPVYVGEDFWFHLTGDHNFYYNLIDTFSEVADELDCKNIIEEVIHKIASEIENSQN